MNHFARTARAIAVCCAAWCTLTATATADIASVRDRVLAPSCVSEVELTAPESSIANLYTDPKGDYQPATMVFDMCGAGTEVFGPLTVTFRLKGSGSFRTLDGKAAFKIKMPSGQRIDGLRSLTLNNMVQDKSQMHEVLAYDAYRGVGLKAPRVGYANVTLNGAGYGLHANVETLDSRFLAANLPSTQHLYEQPDWQEGHTTWRSRDIVPESVPNFEVDEGDEDSRSDLEALAATTEIADDGDWWDAFQANYEVTETLRFFAAAIYVGDFDTYVNFVNNYYLHSTVEGVFRFIPWGTDQSFIHPLALFPDTQSGLVVARCLAVAPCRAAYRDELDFVAERIIELDLPGRALELQSVILDAVADDPRREVTVPEQCQSTNGLIQFLLNRETLWDEDFRDPLADEVAGQSTGRLDCPVTPPDELPPVAPPIETVPAPLPATLLINNGADFVRSDRVRLALSWPQGAAGVEIANSASFAHSAKFARADSIRWRIATSCRSQPRRVVYARFFGPDGSTLASVTARTILDCDPPAVGEVSVRTARGTTTDLLATKYVLGVDATDARSGLATIELQTYKDRAVQRREFQVGKRLIVTTSANRVRLRVTDRAGNRSAWQTLTLRR